MRKTWLILLLLAGCGAGDTGGSGGGSGGGGTDDLSANLMVGVPAPDMNQLQGLIDRAMPAAIPDAANAQYRNLRAGAGQSVCGEVATKWAEGQAGEFRPFLITADGVPVIGNQARVPYENPADFMATAWIRWCATPEELEALASEIKTMEPVIPEPDMNGVAPVTAPIPMPPPDVPMVVQVPPPAAAPAPAAKAEPKAAPPPQIDSFFKSVQRGEKKE
jgi:hypothetical protein